MRSHSTSRLARMAKDVDGYIDRSDRWPAEITALRSVLLGAGLDESIKWYKPCYSHEGRNIAIVQEFKDFLALMFFKGALLADPDGVLEDQGPNSRAAKRICFRSVDDVERLARTVDTYLREAIDVEDAGIELPPAEAPALADALQHRIDEDAAFRAAFEALTPGRRREYNLHIGGAKQAATRSARVDKCAPLILAGKGLRDR